MLTTGIGVLALLIQESFGRFCVHKESRFGCLLFFVKQAVGVFSFAV